MNISQEKTGELTATIRMEIVEDDYQENVNKVLKDHQRKANLPGFRAGKVPYGMVKRMYGKAVLAEEINKLMSSSLDSYIKENELNILAYPLANTEKGKMVDFENDSSFEFFFDIGLSPEINVELSKDIEIDHYKIVPDQKLVDNYVEDARKRFGENEVVEEASENDIVKCAIVELDEDGNEKENGIQNESTLTPKYITDETVKEQFVGAKAGAVIVFNPYKATGNATETSSMLGIKKEEAEKLESEFRFTVTEIQSLVPAAIDKDFFNKVFPGKELEDGEAFFNEVKEQLSLSLQKESDNQLNNDAVKVLLEKADLNLPDDFLKRFLKENNEDVTDEVIEKEYDEYAKSMKWQLIENKIIKEHELQVTDEEIRATIRSYFSATEPENEELKKQLDGIVNNLMQNKEEVERINNQLYTQKMIQLFKEQLSLKEKEISYDDYMKKMNELNKTNK